MKINATKFEYEREIKEVKVLLARMYKGQQIISDAVKTGTMPTAMKGIALYNELSRQMLEKLELCAFLHEYLSMGKTVVINRKGRAVNLDPILKKEEVEIEPYQLRSLQALKEIFGDDFEDMVEFKDAQE